MRDEKILNFIKIKTEQPNLRQYEIAEILGVTEQTLSVWKRSDLYQRYEEMREERSREGWESLILNTFEVLNNIMTDPEVPTAEKIALGKTVISKSPYVSERVDINVSQRPTVAQIKFVDPVELDALTYDADYEEEDEEDDEHWPSVHNISQANEDQERAHSNDQDYNTTNSHPVNNNISVSSQEQGGD